MESTQAKIRKITASWTIDSWYIESGYIYAVINNTTVRFDMQAAGFSDCLHPDKPLELVLEIPHP